MEKFKATEEKLYSYFNKEKIINSLKHKIEILNRQIEQLVKDIRECNITIDEESRCISYEERVQTSSAGTSYAERETVRIIDMKIKRVADKEYEKEKLLERIESIELDNAILDYNLEFINKEYYKILELKYGKKKKEIEISIELNISQSQVNKIKQKMIADISRWEDWRVKE